MGQNAMNLSTQDLDPIERRRIYLTKGAAIVKSYPVNNVVNIDNGEGFVVSTLRSASSNLERLCDDPHSWEPRQNNFGHLTDDQVQAFMAAIAHYGQRLIQETGPRLAALAVYALRTAMLPTPLLFEGTAILNGQGIDIHQEKGRYVRLGMDARMSSDFCAMLHASDTSMYTRELTTTLSVDLARWINAFSSEDRDTVLSLIPKLWVARDYHLRNHPRYFPKKVLATTLHLNTVFSENRPPLKKRVYTATLRNHGPVTGMRLFEVYEESGARTVFVTVSFQGTTAQDLIVMHVDKEISWAHTFSEVTWHFQQDWTQPITRTAQRLYGTLAGSLPNTGQLVGTGDKLRFSATHSVPKFTMRLNEAGKAQFTKLQDLSEFGVTGTEPILMWLGEPTQRQNDALKTVDPMLAQRLL